MASSRGIARQHQRHISGHRHKPDAAHKDARGTQNRRGAAWRHRVVENRCGVSARSHRASTISRKQRQALECSQRDSARAGAAHHMNENGGVARGASEYLGDSAIDAVPVLSRCVAVARCQRLFNDAWHP